MNGEKLFGKELDKANGNDAASVEEKAKKLEEQAAAAGEWDDFVKDVKEETEKETPEQKAAFAKRMKEALDSALIGEVKSYADLVMMEGPKLKSASAMMKDIYGEMVAKMPELGKDTYRNLLAEKIRRAMTTELQKRVDDLEASVAKAEAEGQVAKNEEAMIKLMEALEDVKGAYPEELAA